MAERTPAQKAADRKNGARLRAMMKVRRASSGGGGGGGAPRRRFTRGHTYGAVQVAGGVAIAYGALRAPQPGWSSQLSPSTTYTASQRFYNLKESVPIYGTDPNMATNRSFVAGGALAVAAGKIAKRFPVTKFLHRLSFKVDRKARLALV